MAKTFQNVATANLTERKATLLEQLSVPANAVRASSVQQLLTCGKSNCRCRHGHKHGPFNYLVQCLGRGNVRKFLLKTPQQQRHARAAIAAYAQFRDRLEELSWISTELLRRGELFSE